MAWDSLPFSNALNISSSPVFVIFNERLMSMLPEYRFFQQAYFNRCKIYCNKASISWFTMASCVALSIVPPVAEEVELLEPEDLNSRCSACRFSLETSSAHWLSASQLEYSIF